ncbi:ATP-binding protein [Gordonia paraffinivorans]|uniref:ATP-binding protein n=1 Tax=Gordonia paraffinivorans TaxID=175628 RepID=UPI001C93173A|nr:ATP-binding protein [Gordonia paraffinivorans]MBY4575290.1 ATP-binding protein [Gordonia paraffinivorans]
MPKGLIQATPSAARLTRSLRDIGYDFVSAVADIVDNSIAAGASEIAIEIEFAGSESYVLIADNGRGMSGVDANEALRFGTRRSYESGELGRYGLGLKTASLSQARALTVVSRSAQRARAVRRTLDLDLVERYDDWLITEGPRDEVVRRAEELLESSPGTVVIWQHLDRVLPSSGPTGGWAKRRFETLTRKTRSHLSMVFHRFLAGENRVPRIAISVNGEKLDPWDPFVRHEAATQAMAPQEFELEHSDGVGTVVLHRFILPGKRTFSSREAFEAAAGPLNWNRQQGLYIYRENRLVQWGSWAGTRGIDEHTKLARASLDFGNELDAVFNINVAKMRVSIPSQLKQMLERPISELCILADHTYRRQNVEHEADKAEDEVATERKVSEKVSNTSSAELGLALKSAAIQTGHYDALKAIIDLVQRQNPGVADALGFT